MGERLKTDKVQSAFFNLFWSDDPLWGVAGRGQENANDASLFAFSKKNKNVERRMRARDSFIRRRW